MLNNDILELMPGFFLVLDTADDKVIYMGNAVKKLINISDDNISISELSLKHPGFGRFMDKVINREKDATQICKVIDKYISYTVNYKNGMAYVLGMEVTGLVASGSVEPDKSKDEKLGIYKRNSGMDLLDGMLGGIKDNKRFPFTVSYIILDQDNVSESERDGCIKDFADVVINGIRDTDIFVHAYNNEFFIIFPKCSFNIVSNIIDTIEKKLIILSAAESLPYEFDFECSIMEVDETNTDSAEGLIERVRKLI